MLATTSISKEISCQEGGTSRENEVITSKIPQTRELAKGKPIEGRERGPMGKCSKKMALAMEKWLQETRKLEPKAAGPRRKSQKSGKKGFEETGKG